MLFFTYVRKLKRQIYWSDISLKRLKFQTIFLKENATKLVENFEMKIQQQIIML